MRAVDMSEQHGCPASSAMHASMQNLHESSCHADTQNSTWCPASQERQASLQELPQSTRRRRSAVLTTRGACLYLPHRGCMHQIRTATTAGIPERAANHAVAASKVVCAGQASNPGSIRGSQWQIKSSTSCAAPACQQAGCSRHVMSRSGRHISVGLMEILAPV